MSENKNSSGLLGWIDARFPLTKMFEEHLSKYYAPKNFNFWYFFGSLALLVLVLQIVTGIFLTMHYKPDGDMAFSSVEYIMRDVDWGWLIRYLHSTGSSAFFIVVYLHMFRALIYGSYQKPRELIWLFGMFIFLALMAEAFMGYLLPWGQMSYWGAQVIISLFGAVPVVGDELTLWIRGDFVVSDATLNRFFALHVVAVPIVLLALVVMHIIALHESVKDLVGVVVFLILFSIVVFFMPEMGGYFLEHANFVPANQFKTPEHIAPVWYFTPFYAILRAIPDKLTGVIAMFASIAVLFVLPWIDRGKVKSVRYRSTAFKLLLVMLVISFLGLGYLGALPATETRTMFARVFSLGYFGFFLGLWWISKNEVTKPVPERVR
jgi:ubiquinol-cytochrome c reductase cytochrome b subunit